MQNSIFIQIASYRDPELVPTIKDCILKAKYPNLLSFGICWQHAKEDTWDTLDEFIGRPNFTIMDVPWNESKGACWARHHIQKMWKGQRYTLQLDSHHRFIPHWDEKMILMLYLTGAKKPIITSYAAPYSPTDKRLAMHPPYHMVAKFEKDIILFTPAVIHDYGKLVKPIPARFVSGHYYFTYGIHCQECRYDPELYFTGEEISLSVRSYTMGYDLFHPHRTLLWHEYTRVGRTKHWDDFDDKNRESGKIKQVWHQDDIKSKNRVRVLLKQLVDPSIDLGKYTLGTVRTLKDYELYAGVNFKLSVLHLRTLQGTYAPINDHKYNWKSANTEYKLTLNLPPVDMKDVQFMCICVENTKYVNLYRKDLTSYVDTLIVNLKTETTPLQWVFIVYYKSTGWGKKQIILLNNTNMQKI